MFTSGQMERYSRQILLREVGGVGQKRLLDARLLVVGAGAMGSGALLSLSGAGIGALRVVDHGRVRAERLALEPLHGSDQVGRPKALSAREGLLARRPDGVVEAFSETLTPGRIGSWLDGVDGLVDAVGTPAVRRLLATAAWEAEVPLWSGGVSGDLGWVVGAAGVEGSPCLGCQESTLERAIREAQQQGVDPVVREALGPMLPGQVGTLLASTLLRALLGLKQAPQPGWMFHAAEGRYDAFGVDAQQAGCPVCGP